MSRDLRIAGVLALVAAFAAPGLASGAGTRVLGWGSVDRDATRTHLGNGKQGNFTAPVEIDELDGATEVMVEGVDETFALFGSGVPMSWGEGQNAPWRGGAEAALPVAASESLRGARQIESSYDMALALMPDGTVMAWDSDSAPAPVSGLSGVVDVDAVRGAGLAVLADGTVKSWGSDFHGQLGNGAAAATSAPTTIPGLTGVTRLVGSQFFAHVIALRGDGTLRVWGMDSFGALGDPGVAPELCGGGACRTAPYDPGLQDVQGIGIGEFNGYAVMEDGTVRA